MSPRVRLLVALVTGIGVLVLGMAIVEHMFWAQCSGVDIHRYHEIWMCWNFLHLWVAVASLAGLIAGLIHRKRGLTVGTLVAVAGLTFYSIVYRYPFGEHHVATLQNGFLFFVLPCATGCVLGALFTVRAWKHAL